MSERKVCTYCGREGHLAHACPVRREVPDVEIITDPAAIEAAFAGDDEVKHG